MSDSGLVQDPALSESSSWELLRAVLGGTSLLIFAVFVKLLRGKPRAVLGYPSHHLKGTLLYVKSSKTRSGTCISNNNM